MTYPKEYIQFLVHFHGDRDYFECHEILEEYWKENDEKNKQSVWVGLIQIAVSMYHYRRNNLSGAKKLLLKASRILIDSQQKLQNLGLDTEKLFRQFKTINQQIEKKQPYSSINLPIIDPELITLCKELCIIENIRWCAPSKLEDFTLVHKHSLRDRTDVIQNREKSLLQKQQNKQG